MRGANLVLMRRALSPGSMVVAVLLAVATLLAAACGSDVPEPEAFSGYTVDPPSDVSEVVLPAVDGSESQSVVADADGLRVVFFGYTSCPDVCPTTMSDLSTALESMPADDAARISVAMVTVDPERDTPDVLQGYVSQWIDDGSLALRTDDPDQLRAAADAFGANYSVETDAEGEVEVAHSGELYAVADDGTVVMQWPFGTSNEALARDFSGLLARQDNAAGESA